MRPLSPILFYSPPLVAIRLVILRRPSSPPTHLPALLITTLSLLVHSRSSSLSTHPNRYDSVTVMFSGIVGFAKYCAENSDAEAMKIVTMLNELYTLFDELTDPSRNPNIYKVSEREGKRERGKIQLFCGTEHPGGEGWGGVDGGRSTAASLTPI